MHRIGPDICHRGWAYTVLQTVQRPGVYGTVHYKEPLKSFEIGVGHSPASGFFLSRYCHDCAESNIHIHMYLKYIYRVLNLDPCYLYTVLPQCILPFLIKLSHNRRLKQSSHNKDCRTFIMFIA